MSKVREWPVVLALCVLGCGPVAAQRAADLLKAAEAAADSADAAAPEAAVAPAAPVERWWAELGAIRTAYAEHYLSTGQPPGNGELDFDNISVRDGLILVQGRFQRPDCEEATIAIAPYVRIGSEYAAIEGFQCGFAALPDGMRSLADAIPAQRTTLKRQELPARCGGSAPALPPKCATADEMATDAAEQAARAADQAAARDERLATIAALRDTGARCHAALTSDDPGALLMCALPEQAATELRASWQGETADPERTAQHEQQLHALIADGGIDALVADAAPHLKELSAQWPMMVAMGQGAMRQTVDAQGFSAQQRALAIAAIQVLGTCLSQVDIGDTQRLRAALTHLASAIRPQDVPAYARLESLPFDQAMQQLQPVWRATRLSLREYGIDLVELADSMQIHSTTTADGEVTARLSFRLGGQPHDLQLEL